MNNYCKFLRLFVTICVSLIVFSSVVAASGKWMIASNTLNSSGRATEDSVLIWNPSYTEGETVEWYGGKIYDHSRGSFFANGEGRATWYLNGEFEQSDEGNHFLGMRHGKVVQHFADGRTKVTYWKNGFELH